MRTSIVKKAAPVAVLSIVGFAALSSGPPEAKADGPSVAAPADWVKKFQEFLCGDKNAIDQEKQEVTRLCVGEKGSKNVEFERWALNTYDDADSVCTRKGNPAAPEEPCTKDQKLNMWLKIKVDTPAYKGLVCLKLGGTFTGTWNQGVEAVDKLYTTDTDGQPIYSDMEFPPGKAVKIKGLWGMTAAISISGKLQLKAGPATSDDCDKATTPDSSEEPKIQEGLGKTLGIAGFKLDIEGGLECSTIIKSAPAVVLQTVPTSCKKPSQ